MNALARSFEAAGLTTVVINMMPVWGERFGTPRTLGVEFPFGHPVGPPDDATLQTRVVRSALALLTADGPPPVVRHFDEPWPLDFDAWKKAWQPPVPSPMIRWLREQAAQRARDRHDG